MGTWVGVIVETNGRVDFWDVARGHGVEALTTAVPSGHALIDCGARFEEAPRLAQSMSRDLGSMALCFGAQTAADVYGMEAFWRGESVRRLSYARDEGGWLIVEGVPQAWEAAYFFDGASPAAGGDEWPDLLHEDLSDEDIARYEDAKRSGDPQAIMDLLNPSSMAPLHRVCQFFNVMADTPSARWVQPSFWARLFRRSRR